MCHREHRPCHLHQPLSLLHDDVKVVLFVNPKHRRCQRLQGLSMLAKFSIVVAPLYTVIHWTSQLAQLFSMRKQALEMVDSDCVKDWADQICAHLFPVMTRSLASKVVVARHFGIESPLVEHGRILEAFSHLRVGAVNSCGGAGELGLVCHLQNGIRLFGGQADRHRLLAAVHHVELVLAVYALGVGGTGQGLVLHRDDVLLGELVLVAHLEHRAGQALGRVGALGHLGIVVAALRHIDGEGEAVLGGGLLAGWRLLRELVPPLHRVQRSVHLRNRAKISFI